MAAIETIFKFDRRQPDVPTPLSMSQLMSASVTLSMTGVHELQLTTTEWLPHGTRLVFDIAGMGGTHEFVVDGIESELNSSTYALPRYVHTYTASSSMVHDLTSTLGGSVSFINQHRFAEGMDAVMEPSPWTMTVSSVTGITMEDGTIEGDTAWDMVVAAPGFASPTSQPAGSTFFGFSIRGILTSNLSAVITARRVGYQPVMHYQGDTVPRITQDDPGVMGMRRTFDGGNIYGKVGMYDKNGTPLGTPRRGSADAWYKVYKNGAAESYNPTMRYKSDYDFTIPAERTAASTWIAANAYGLTVPSASYEVNYATPTSYRPGDVVEVAMTMLPTITGVETQQTFPDLKCVSQVTTDLLTGVQRVTLGNPIRYMPVMQERKGV